MAARKKSPPRHPGKKSTRVPSQKPLWLVRWQNLSAAIIRARDEQEVRDIMDELADPGGCEIVPYDGPVWFELNLTAQTKFRKDVDDNVDDQEERVERPMTEADVKLENVESLLDPGFVIECSIGPAETGGEMHDRILATAFPAIASARDQVDLDSEPTAADKEAIEAAAWEDLAPLFRHSWRRVTQKRRAEAGDRSAQINEFMGVTTDPDEDV